MSYRYYLYTSLNRNELMNATKSAPKGLRYCNAMCQDFRKTDEFSNQIPMCKGCRNTINIAEKKFKEGSITLEQFKENPEIVKGVEIVFDTNKKCDKCKQEKSINNFESCKNVCKACRSFEAVTRNNKDMDIIISDIEKAKNNLIVLENFVKSIPKDKLIKVVSHFEIGRKATDKKEDIIYNIINHFRKLLQPKLCQGGCGSTLQEEFKTCLGCENKKEKPRAISKMISFAENIDEIVANLPIITKDNFDVYTREQLYRIHEKLTGIKPKQTTLKTQVVDMVNAIITKREEEKKLAKENISKSNSVQNNLGGEITLNGISVLAREDGFINATAMCKAGKKEFKHWNALESTKELIKVLEESENAETRIPTDLSMSVGIRTDLSKNLIDIIKNGPNNKRGSWIHPDLAVQLAQWISPLFSIQVSKWVRELALTGSVVVGNEKTHQELISLQNEVIKQREMINSLENKHNKFLEKQKYHQFKEGPVFYIISDNDSKTIKFKPGIEGTDINRRLAEHRSTTPEIKLEYLIYTKDNAIIEKNILKRYKVTRLYQNREWIYEIKKEHIIDSVKVLLDFLNIEYTEENNLEEYNKHIETL